MNNSSPATIVVAIDGPSASGKSTVSRLVAEKLEFIYVDSGALYRGVTWKAVSENLDVTDSDIVIEMARYATWKFYTENRVVRFTIDGDDPGNELRSAPVRQRVADVAAIPEIRAFIVEHLRKMIRFGDTVMEGRDIGTVVFPTTGFKFYLDADPHERARRRSLDLARRNEEGDVTRVLSELRKRDHKDSSRKTAPLQIALGANVIDTTAMTIEAVVKLIVAEVRARIK